MRRPGLLRLALFASVLLTLVAVLPSGAAQKAPATDAQIKTDIERKIADLKVARSRVMVSVSDHVVNLEGTLPTLWVKNQIIDYARKLEGIKEVRSTMEITRAESDAQLAQEVGKQLKGYSRYTVYDYVDGNVRDAVVTLTGAVTQVDKHADIVERIEKIRGVRELRDQVKVADVVPSDDQIRLVLASQIYADPIFRQYSLADPPIHMIVDHGHVTLIGIVASDLERQKAYQLARSISGVYTVDNQIKTAAELRGK